MSCTWNGHDRHGPPAAGPSSVPYPRLFIPCADYLSPQPASAQHDPHETPAVQSRQMQELHAERAYMLNSLRRENSKATVLLERILTLERGLHQKKVASAEKKAKKQLGWLKHRVNETNQQENAMLARLGQLTSDIQSLEAWLHGENERRRQSIAANTPSHICRSPHQLNLDPTSPEFRPRGYQVQWNSVKWPSKECPPNCVVDSEEDASVPEEGLNEDNICPTEQHPENEMGQTDRMLVPQTTPRSSSLDSTMLDGSFTNTSPRESARAKRLSLPIIPGLSTIWALAEKEEENEVNNDERSFSLDYHVMV